MLTISLLTFLISLTRFCRTYPNINASVLIPKRLLMIAAREGLTLFCISLSAVSMRKMKDQRVHTFVFNRAQCGIWAIAHCFVCRIGDSSRRESHCTGFLNNHTTLFVAFPYGLCYFREQSCMVVWLLKDRHNDIVPLFLYESKYFK